MEKNNKLNETETKLDILAFGAHADDVEIGMGGTIAKYAALGKKIGICDLTHAELSSNGTVERRKQEAKKAARILNVQVRETLLLPDRGLYLNDEHINMIVDIIRRYQPTIIFAPYLEDRHPDHGNCGRLVEEANFSAGIRKYTAGGELQANRADRLYFYMINGFHKPEMTVDISEYIDTKIAALSAYESQFEKEKGSVATPLNFGYIDSVVARERLFGTEVGVNYAEGFKTKKPLLIHHDLLGEKE